MEKKLYFYVIVYHWEGNEELSYYHSPVIYDDKKEFIKCFSRQLYQCTTDPRCEVVGFRTFGYNVMDKQGKDSKDVSCYDCEYCQPEKMHCSFVDMGVCYPDVGCSDYKKKVL